MKAIYHLCGKISLLCYIFILYQLWHLCQFGGIRMHLAVLVPVGAVFLVSFVADLQKIHRKREEAKLHADEISVGGRACGIYCYGLSDRPDHLRRDSL